jgi:hypothetical protein
VSAEGYFPRSRGEYELQRHCTHWSDCFNPPTDGSPFCESHHRDQLKKGAELRRTVKSQNKKGRKR